MTIETSDEMPAHRLRFDEDASVSVIGDSNLSIPSESSRDSNYASISSSQESLNIFQPNFCEGYKAFKELNIHTMLPLQFCSYSTFGPKSDCKLSYSFSLASAIKISTYACCTNRPIIWELCNSVYWSYNMQKHYESKHNQCEIPEFISSDEIKN